MARVRPDEYQVHKYRIARTSIDGHNAPRRLMFEATVIEETDGKAILRVADEALLVVSTLDELLRTLGLEREDLIDA